MGNIVLNKPDREYSARLSRRLGRPAEELSDAMLIESCLAGEALAWDTLIERHAPLIFAAARRCGLSQDDAGDIFQEVCLLLFNHLASLRDCTRLPGWLVTTTKREAWRVQKRRKTALFSDLDGEDPASTGLDSTNVVQTAGPESELIKLEERHLVSIAMGRIPERCRRLLALLYADDPPKSYTDISQEMKIPVGGIGPTRARCLRSLKLILEELEF